MTEPSTTTREILQRASSVPAKTKFPTVDELHAGMEALREQHSEIISVRRVGTSRLGEHLPLYTFGDGELQVLIIGGVHPNEPIGSWTVLHLTEQLAEDPGLRETMGATWHIMPCADPDAMRLNEGWFDLPSDRGEYSRHFYRPAGNEQVEWTFPFSYKKAYFDTMLPETQAMARAIDDVRPDLYVPLHNAESGGVYYYLSREEPALQHMLHRLPEHLGLPLDKGEPESAHFRELAPAIFEMGTREEAYDWVESLGMDPAPPGGAGESSAGYARKYGTLSMIAELPYWSSPAAEDTTPVDQSYSEILVEYGQALVQSGNTMVRLLERAEPHLTLDTPLIRASRVFVPGVKKSGEHSLRRAENPETERPATVAEQHGNADVLHMFRLRFGGTLLRALRAETAAGTASPELHRIAAELEKVFEEWAAEAEQADPGALVPVETVVGLQYGAVLAACAHLHGLLDSQPEQISVGERSS